MEIKSKKKTILYHGGFILPDGNAAAHRVMANAKILRELGLNVIFIGVSKSKENFKKRQFIKCEIQGFLVYEVPYPDNSIKWLLYLVSIKILKKIVREIGKENLLSIIAYNPSSLIHIRTNRFCSSINVKYLLDITEWYHVATGSKIFKLIKNLDSNIRMKYLNFKCDGIITISRFLDDYYKKRKTTVLLPPLVDLGEKKWPASVPQIEKKKKVFTIIGIPNRNKESLLQFFIVLSNLKNKYDFSINIIGASKKDLIKVDPEIHQYFENLDSNINFLGRLTNEETINYVSKSHFFVFLRYQSIVTKAGFPTKFVESISAGTPVLTNKTSNLDDYLVEGKNGYWLYPENTGKLESQVEFILNLKNEKEIEMKNYCLDSREFNYRKFVGKMDEFLNVLK